MDSEGCTPMFLLLVKLYMRRRPDRPAIEDRRAGQLIRVPLPVRLVLLPATVIHVKIYIIKHTCKISAICNVTVYYNNIIISLSSLFKRTYVGTVL